MSLVGIAEHVAGLQRASLDVEQVEDVVAAFMFTGRLQGLSKVVFTDETFSHCGTLALIFRK